MTDVFDILALDRTGDPAVPELAAAAARAGGLGIVDVECAPHGTAAAALRGVRWLLDRVPASRIGLRLPPSRLEEFAAALAELDVHGATIVLSDVPSAADASRARGTGSRLLIEVRSVAECAAAESVGGDGVIAVGHEAGGRVGADTSFVLLQRVLRDGGPRVYVRGGLGLRTAAGCRAAGAAGVVLDDQLLLAPEAGLPAAWRAHLTALSGQETIVLGPRDRAWRLLDRPAFGGLTRLKNVARAVESAGGAADGDWHDAVAATVGWGAPEQRAWPAGQAVLLAAAYRRDYGTAEAIVAAFARETAHLVDLARRIQPLKAGAPLAQSHGTHFPIVQGPMTRVSDRAEFARAVADAGALPLIALAVLTGAQARPVLAETRERLGTLPWGVGILGFVPPDLKREQVDEMRHAGASFALIAGGRPDESSALEALGIPTYLHVPVPSLLRRFVNQGARRFVFEGRECGGHVGPLCSFPLWEAMIAVLLDEAKRVDPASLHVLFAGGIHDARSALIVSTLAAPLAERGIKVGVLMGTAYLFTEEAVATGAITARYQNEAIRCEETVLLPSGVGHANRVAHTTFADEYEQRRLALQRAGRPAGEIREELEQLTLGRLRLASKGVTRGPGTELVTASDEEQASGGIYMLGQAATLRSAAVRMIDLHRGIADCLAAAAAPSVRRRVAPDAPVAIVGVATLVPGAQDAERLWRNVLDRVSAIRELPDDRWDVRLLFDPERSARDKSVSKWGGFFDAVPFDPAAHRIPPAVLRHVCAHQLLALELTRWALADAGYAERPFDRERTAVILAAAETGGWQGNRLIMRSMLPFFFDEVPEEVLARLPEWTPESFAGMLGNVSAGRIANQLDLRGPNYVLDAACASSLIALEQAVRELQTGRSAMVLAGAVDTSQTPFSYLAFSKTQALSPSGQARVFDQRADGIVVSEAVVMLALKRLEDAERDGDRIYSVIRGTGASSDGRGLGLTAPRVEGQRLALERAFESAGVEPAEIECYEAHGTGTPLGDRTEIETLVGMMSAGGARAHQCAVGSIKSLIGHTKAVAGLVGVVKASLALRHRVFPPHAGVTDPIDALRQPTSPLQLLDAPRPWLEPEGGRRLAGVCAFGFGGTNGAAILEEAPASRGCAGADEWPAELFLFGAADPAALTQTLSTVQSALKDGAEPRLRDLAAALADAFEAQPWGARLAFTAATLAELSSRLADAIAAARDGRVVPGVSYSAVPADAGGVACLFPGQGSQYPGMTLEHTLYFEEPRAVIAAANVAVPRDAAPLSSIMFPSAAFSREESDAQGRALAATDAAQPAIGAASAGLYDLMLRLGLRPGALAGHSFGELTALHAAGVCSRGTFLRLAHARGRVMQLSTEPGAMLSAAASRADTERLLGGIHGITIAAHNSPQRTVVSGSPRAIADAEAALAAAGVRGDRLAVSGAFHSPLMQGAVAPWSAALTYETFHDVALPDVYSTVTGARYGAGADEARRLLTAQLLQPVEFVNTIERMYADGIRTFIEVGPGSVLSRLTAGILGDRPATIVPVDPNAGRLAGFLASIGTLAVAGVPLRPSRLFDGRPLRALALDRLIDTRPAPLGKDVWLVDGLSARPQVETGVGGATAALLTKETRHPERRAALPGAASVAAPSALPTLPPLPAVAGGQSADAIVAAYAAYQQTMQRFLEVQQHALATFLGVSGGMSAAPIAMPQPAVAAVPAPVVVPQPIAAPRAAPPPASTVTDVTVEDVKTLLLAATSAQTGYPIDMLGLTLDLSGDLGVDSIRHVQILNDVAARLAPEVSARLERIMEPLARARTLQAVLDEIAAVLTAPSVTAPAVVAAAPAAPAPLDAAGVLAALQRITSERTGYPVDMLDPGHDLEADLGVDSIRRVDIVQTALERLGSTRPDSAFVEQAMHARSLGGLASLLSGAAVAPAHAITAATVNMGDEAAADCPRYVMRDLVRPLPASPAHDIRGLVLMTADELGVSVQLAEMLRAAGAEPLVLDGDALHDTASLRHRLSSVDGTVAAVVHLAPLTTAPMPAEIAGWKRRTQIEAKALFTILQHAGAHPPASPLRVVAASLMGGWFGRDGVVAPGLPTGGAAVGLLKSLALEWPSLAARAVDFGAEADAAQIARTLFDELRHDDITIEVGYAGGIRRVFVAVPAPLDAGTVPSTARTLASDCVVLATGGARGITAQALSAIARPGMIVVLAGRREPTRQTASALDDVPAERLREHFIAESRDGEERLTPAQIESRVQAVLRDREILQTISGLEEAGVTVVYRSCDVRDPASFSGLIDWTYATFGRINAVIHGAGVIEDKLLADKTPASLDRVFDTKVDSAYVLARQLRAEGLELVVFFSSVAGRFGSRGQSDYAAANEVLNRFAWLLQSRWSAARVVSVNWGPWSGGGMATEAVRELLRARGIVAIPPEAGCAFLREEVTRGSAVAEVIAGEGPWMEETAQTAGLRIRTS